MLDLRFLINQIQQPFRYLYVNACFQINTISISKTYFIYKIKAIPFPRSNWAISVLHSFVQLTS